MKQEGQEEKERKGRKEGGETERRKWRGGKEEEGKRGEEKNCKVKWHRKTFQPHSTHLRIQVFQLLIRIIHAGWQSSVKLKLRVVIS